MSKNSSITISNGHASTDNGDSDRNGNVHVAIGSTVHDTTSSDAAEDAGESISNPEKQMPDIVNSNENSNVPTANGEKNSEGGVHQNNSPENGASNKKRSRLENGDPDAPKSIHIEGEIVESKPNHFTRSKRVRNNDDVQDETAEKVKNNVEKNAKQARPVVPKRESARLKAAAEMADEDDTSTASTPPGSVTDTSLPQQDDTDLAAILLSRIDESSYQKALLQDANTLLEECLLPMCFTWTHPIVPVLQNMTRDIEELPAIIGEEDVLFEPFDNGPFDYGKFEIGKKPQIPDIHRTPKNINDVRLASRRSEDPGVVELTIVKPLNQSLANSIGSNKMKMSLAATNEYQDVTFDQQDEENIGNMSECEDGYVSDGEIAYEYFKQSQVAKQKKLNESTKTISKKTISIRVGSVSSRSSIFASEIISSEKTKIDGAGLNDHHQIKTKKLVPLLCEAYLPIEVHTGRSVTIERSVKLDKAGATHNDSYDARFDSTNPKAKITKAMMSERDNRGRLKRVNVGRNRKVWTCRKATGSNLTRGATSGKNRTVFADVLTGEHLNDLSIKRPREVLVGIRLNGKLLAKEVTEKVTSETSVFEELVLSDENSELVNKTTEDVIVAPGAKSLNDALNAACPNLVETSNDVSYERETPLKPAETRPYAHENAVCTLNTDKLMKIICSKGNSSSSLAETKRRQADGDNDTAVLQCCPPVIDCLPLNEGFLRTVCTSSGSMNAINVNRLLNLSSKKKGSEHLLCSVCWSGNFDDEGEKLEVLECVDCGATAHLECCSVSGELRIEDSKEKEWSCAVCSDKREKGLLSKNVTVIDGSGKKQTHDISGKLSGEGDYTCALCPHSGGIMGPAQSKSRSAAKEMWEHEICKIWCNPSSSPAPLDALVCSELRRKTIDVCALCGLGSNMPDERNGLVKCAARGCYVKFHPMCALLVDKHEDELSKGKTDKMGNDSNNGTVVPEQSSYSLKETKERDSDLCRRFTLTLMKCTRTENKDPKSFGTKESDGTDIAKIEKTSILPIAFCGIHNPKRERLYYGCPPACGSGYMFDNNSVMYIPPIRNPAKTY